MYLNGGRYADAQIISEASVAAGTRGYIASGGTSFYGLGWRLAPDGAYSHSGSDGTMGWVDPSRELIGMVFTQSPGGKNPRREFQQLVRQAVDAGVAEQ